MSEEKKQTEEQYIAELERRVMGGFVAFGGKVHGAKIDEKFYLELKDATKKNPELFEKVLREQIEYPAQAFMTMCAFYRRDMGCTYAEAHAHAVKAHPELYQLFLEVNIKR